MKYSIFSFFVLNKAPFCLVLAAGVITIAFLAYSFNNFGAQYATVSIKLMNHSFVSPSVMVGGYWECVTSAAGW